MTGGCCWLRPMRDAVFLGLSGDRPLFADDAVDGEPERGHPAGLREAATELPADEAALAAYAAALLSLAPPPPLLRQLRRRDRGASTAGTSAAARPATRTTSRAPTRW